MGMSFPVNTEVSTAPVLVGAVFYFSCLKHHPDAPYVQGK